jgi:hypothetical protein
VGKPEFFNKWENVRYVHVNTLNSWRSCNIKISLAGRRNKSNTNHYPKTMLRTGQMSAQIKLSYFVITMTGLKSAQRKSLRSAHKLPSIDRWLTWKIPVRKYDISQVGTGSTFLFVKLSKSLHLYSHFNLPAKQHGEPWASTPTPQSPHDERPHLSHFICSTIFRAATYVSHKSDRYIFFIILNFFCVWDWVQQQQQQSLFRNWWRTRL